MSCIYLCWWSKHKLCNLDRSLPDGNQEADRSRQPSTSDASEEKWDDFKKSGSSICKVSFYELINSFSQCEDPPSCFRYNSLDQLVCSLCQTRVKSAALWNAHLMSRSHKNVSQAQIHFRNKQIVWLFLYFQNLESQTASNSMSSEEPAAKIPRTTNPPALTTGNTQPSSSNSGLQSLVDFGSSSEEEEEKEKEKVKTSAPKEGLPAGKCSVNEGWGLPQAWSFFLKKNFDSLSHPVNPV